MAVTAEARVLRGVAGVYLLSNPQTGFKGQAVARGLFRKEGISPLPGDVVTYVSAEDPDIPWLITSIRERKNSLRRPALANIDLILLVASAELPRLDFHYLDRMVVYALNNQIELILLLTKCDLAGTAENIAEFQAYYKPSGLEMYQVGLDSDRIIPCLKERIQGCLAVFAGQSGVGKSTLMNRMLGTEVLETGLLSEKAGKGRQTTRSVEIYQVGQAFLADTPGFQSLDVQNMEIEGRELLAGYPELLAIADRCRFADCRHMGELGCAVEESKIHPERLKTYRRLRAELESQIRY